MTTLGTPSSLGSFIAMLAAVASTAGSFYLSLGLGLIACPICYYQRTFAIAVLIMLVVGYFSPLRDLNILNLLAFGPTVAGLLIAIIHTWLDGVGQQICPRGLFQLGSTSQQSLASYVLILLPLLYGLRDDLQHGHVRMAAITSSIIVAGVMAVMCVIASPEVPLLDHHDPLMCYRPALPH